MALPVNIDDLVNHRKVEWARIEYKEGWNPEKVLHTICAFANDIDNWGGGYVILCVAEKDGKPVFPVKGLSENEIDAINKELLEKCHLLDPLYLPVVEPVEFDGKQLLVIWVPGGPERPYKCPVAIRKDAKSEKAYYIRKMASTVRASRIDEKALFELAGDVPFDDRPNVHADVADLKVHELDYALEHVLLIGHGSRGEVESLLEVVLRHGLLMLGELRVDHIGRAHEQLAEGAEHLDGGAYGVADEARESQAVLLGEDLWQDLTEKQD